MPAPIYIKAGVNFRDQVVVQTAVGVFTTGLVDASFTKRLSNGVTGNLSTAGLTITEVSAANNPGVYDILVPAALIATNGSYTLVVFVTADQTFSYSQEYLVTTDGTPSGAGSLTFTPTAANGRIVNASGTALSGATVYLSYSGYITSFVSDASGLWGPWATSPSVGTVVMTVTKSGYGTQTSSLTVGASSVTGPLIDIGLTAVATIATTVASELWAFAKRMANNKPGTQADIKYKQLVNDAIDRLAMEKSWNWYTRKGFISVETPYATGTIALTQGATTCVLTGGSFPTWAATGRLYINGVPVLNVASRNSTTSLTLAANFGGATASYTYTLFLDNYALEANAFEFISVMSGQNWPYAAGACTIERLWELQDSWAGNAARAPWSFAIAGGRMHLYPYPSTAAQVSYIYRARPAPLDADTDIADIDPVWIHTLRHLISFYVCTYFGESVTGDAASCLSLYNDSLARLIANDKSPRGVGATKTGRGTYWQVQGWGTP